MTLTKCKKDLGQPDAPGGCVEKLAVYEVFEGGLGLAPGEAPMRHLLHKPGRHVLEPPTRTIKLRILLIYSYLTSYYSPIFRKE
jgi:hypothetical protein